MLKPESYLCDLLNWKSICCQWSNKLLLIFSIGGYSHGAFWYIFFIKTLFRKKKNQNANTAKKILWGTEIKKKINQRVLRVTPEKRNRAKRRIATPPQTAEKCGGFNRHNNLIWTHSTSWEKTQEEWLGHQKPTDAKASHCRRKP